MYLIYIDESGNTGLNLKDAEQPVFLLAAIAIPEEIWFEIEKDFYEIKEQYLGKKLAHEYEIHATDLKSRRGGFKKMTLEQQLEFRDKMLQLLVKYNVAVFYKRIIKDKFREFCERHYGTGIKVNPYIMALPFVCMEVDHYIRDLGAEKRWMLIFDEQKENLVDVERSLRILRLDSGSVLQTERLLEKGFFVDSSKSFALQLVDIAAYYLRKYEEHKLGKRVSNIDMETFALLQKIARTDTMAKSQDILDWVKDNCL